MSTAVDRHDGGNNRASSSTQTAVTPTAGPCSSTDEGVEPGEPALPGPAAPRSRARPVPPPGPLGSPVGDEPIRLGQQQAMLGGSVATALTVAHRPSEPSPVGDLAVQQRDHERSRGECSASNCPITHRAEPRTSGSGPASPSAPSRSDTVAGAAAITSAGSARPDREAVVSAAWSAMPTRTVRKPASPGRRSHNRQSGMAAACSTAAASGKSRCRLLSSAVSRASNSARASALGLGVRRAGTGTASTPFPAVDHCPGQHGQRAQQREGQELAVVHEDCAADTEYRWRQRGQPVQPWPAYRGRLGGELHRLAGERLADAGRPMYQQPTVTVGSDRRRRLGCGSTHNRELPTVSSGVPMSQGGPRDHGRRSARCRWWNPDRAPRHPRARRGVRHAAVRRPGRRVQMRLAGAADQVAATGQGDHLAAVRAADDSQLKSGHRPARAVLVPAPMAITHPDRRPARPARRGATSGLPSLNRGRLPRTPSGTEQRSSCPAVAPGSAVTSTSRSHPP